MQYQTNEKMSAHTRTLRKREENVFYQRFFFIFTCREPFAGVRTNTLN